MATLWTSSAVKTLYVRELGNVTSGPIEGVLSCDSIDVDNYDNSNYRDTFFDPAQSDSNLIITVGAKANATDYVTKGTEGGVFTDGAIGGGGGLGDVKTATDEVSHIPPRHELKKRTQIRLWSGASGTGNVLYAGWADEIVSFSLAPYTFI